jgi:hypothetical protein
MKKKARKHFDGNKTMMIYFQSKFGKYPFSYEDGYKLVQPYWSMELKVL